MAVISTNDYKAIMNDYAAAQNQLVGIADNYYDAAYRILLINVFDPEIDLLIPFNNAYLTSQTAYNSAPASVIAAVNKLQRHILNKGVSQGIGSGQTAGEKYDDINDYYADHPIAFPTGASAVIPTTFASLSQQAGHEIESTYIAP
jgi:hypothetical protein